MSNRKTEALIKMNEAIAYLSEAFIEEDQILNQIHDELQNIIAWGKEQDDKIYKLEQQAEHYQCRISYLEADLYKQQEKNKKIANILLEE
jgi:hypothetical protein